MSSIDNNSKLYVKSKVEGQSEDLFIRDLNTTIKYNSKDEKGF